MTDDPDQVVEAVLSAYRQGYFPMAEPGRPRRRGGSRLVWLNPDPRAILPLDGFHVSRSLRRRVRSGRFRITTDEAFAEVIRGCAAPRWYESETWIDDWIIETYTHLHRAGWAHSVEAWIGPGGPGGRPARDVTPSDAADPSIGEPTHGSIEHATTGAEPPVLVGGVYGLAIGAAFFAESMFCRPDLGGTDASKVALAHLVHHLRRRGFVLLDVQFWNEHLDQFGCVEIRRREYLARLRDAVARPVEWPPFEPERPIADP